MEITKSQQTSSVSNISELTQVTDFAATTSINQCSESWIQMQHSIQMEQNHVKDHLFKKVKVISSQKQMIFSSKKSSISYQICNNLNIKTEHQPLFWSIYNKHVEKAVSTARNDAVQASKKLFMKGKYHIEIYVFVLPCYEV